MKEKKTTLPLAVLVMVIIMAMMIGSIKLGIGIVVPLFLCWFVVYCFSRYLGYDFDKVFAKGMDAFRKASGALSIILTVGILIGSLIAAGTIPAFIYYGLKLINPKIFLFCSVLITALMALVTGTSYGSAASAGIAMMGIGTAMGMPTGMVAAAVITGALFGDKLSPLSDIPVLCTGLVEGDLFKNIKYNLWTSVPPFIISLVIFLFMGMRFDSGNYDAAAVNEVLETLSANFHISPLALLPAVAVVIMLVLKVPSVPAILGGSLVGTAVAVGYQGLSFKTALSCMYGGFSIETGVEVVDKLLNRGGLSSMMSSVYILIGAVILGGMLDAIGVINAFLAPIIPKLNSEKRIIGATFATAAFINLVGSAAWLSNILTSQLMLPIYKKNNMEPELLSRTMEDCYIFATIIFPWHAMTVYFTSVLGCTWSSYMPYLFYSYLTPVFTLICTMTGIGMYHKKEKNNEKV